MAHQKKWSGKVLPQPSKPIISAKEARKLLGKDAIDMSDASIMGVVSSLSKIANHLLDSVKVPSTQMV